MRAVALVVAVAACGAGSTPPPATTFEYSATAVWTITETPNVTSFTIDGRPYASGEFYSIDEVYPTYDDALASFVPRDVVITTTTETLNFQIHITPCDSLSGVTFDMPVTKETEDFDALLPLQPSSQSVAFGSGCVRCETKDLTGASCP